ncbi:MAG: TatD family hydrolase [Candidatus Marinimicrobia bacterium]|jgi:TatD DNase family protein|nr:TatD family hydrolase [Candidatus Neomarinimicrobiota bacterium]MBT5115976.1 TatD family hydrolase [Candidatus Neomarinimicrobiota bacterium]MBT6413922.1 TatD family hydrolase [Candidatus Neomarinimicrobiota bacterium]MBT6796516.1 TatD family hydrolase [Candidatus Neomarinimicrobiota bacterium]MBT6867253.1 TatD family hydrolase [Candidatus Neomarinimicrobiota bacterium]|tara:strand:+ start:10212 stop:10973 length:762 start_codon:yes stop_codon:yes gene_type:complete
MLTDTHCHLFYEDLKNNLSDVLKRAEELGVNRFICVATNMEDARECLLLGETHDNIFASVGVHPHDAKDAPEDFVDQIYDLMTFDSMVAVGEMGLDYFRNISDPEIQKDVFRTQMEIAQELNKPIIFHNRDADQDMIKILKEFPNVRGVAHCFSSNLETANAFLDLGYYISFSGNLTFKNSHLPEVAKELPLDRILVETDSPYLSPVPHRGKPNEPGRTRFVAEKLAEIHGVSLELIAEKTTENASSLFQISE